MRTFLLSILFLLSIQLEAQNPLSYYVGEHSWKYTVVTPPGRSKGMIVFIPGYTQTAETIMNELDIHNMAYKYGLTTVIMPFGSKLFADREVVKTLNEALSRVMSDHNIPKDKTVIGGYAIGGSIAMRYAEFTKQFPNDYPINPQAVFMVDSPLDLEQYYLQLDRNVKRSTSTAQSVFFKQLLEKDLKGSPDSNPMSYADYSPFDYDNPSGGNIEILKKTSVRSYHEPDLIWEMTNNQAGFMNMNVVIASEAINTLNLLGNEKAEIVLVNTIGHNQNVSRNPHSLTILNELDLLVWILNNLQIPINTAIQKNFNTN